MKRKPKYGSRKTRRLLKRFLKGPSWWDRVVRGVEW